MYIDTHTKDTIQKSICDIFNIKVRELEELFIRATKESCAGMLTDGDKLDNVLNEFIDDRMCNKNIDQILFFHLGRRLNSVGDCVEGKNLLELLSDENEMSMFFKNHEVKFKERDGHLDLYYKDELISLEDKNKYNVPYLRWRLGYNSNRIDYCFNGFAFRDLIFKNSYARSLYSAPEFLGSLSEFLRHPSMKKDYFDNSKYYCFEYLVPIDKIYFDANEKLNKLDKQKYLLNQILHRLYEYSIRESRFMFDHDNPIIRLSDYDVMQEEYFVSKEEITMEMLG